MNLKAGVGVQPTQVFLLVFVKAVIYGTVFLPRISPLVDAGLGGDFTMIRFPDFGTTIFAVCAKLVLSMTACLFLVIGPYRVFAQDRPNVLFLFADDFTYEAISAFGHTDIETPNLDRLVSRGTTFTHAYNMGSWSGAVCVASVCPEIASKLFFGKPNGQDCSSKN